MSTPTDILVIDDEPTITQVVVKVCRAEGMTVTAANDASEALHCLESDSFRLALCDIMMHGLDGFQFLEELANRGIQLPVDRLFDHGKCGQKPDVDRHRGLHCETVHRRRNDDGHPP
jgi:CheY-like chemotaxis protein